MIKKVLFGVLFFFAMVRPVFAVDEDTLTSGPGYEDLKDKVFKYEYVDFGGFKVLVADNKLKWEGFIGLSIGLTHEEDPQISRVSDGVYFGSWATSRPGTGDNVVWNFKEMTVFAHLGGGDDFNMIHGTIYCYGSIGECEGPVNEVTPPQQFMKKLEENIRSMAEQGKKVSPIDPLDPNTPVKKTEGYAALLNKALHYRFDDGTEVKLAMTGEKITVHYIGHEGAIQKKPHISLIDDDIYLISWGGSHGGEHIVFNAKEMKVYDQIDTQGSRVALEARATCFGDIKDCPVPEELNGGCHGTETTHR